MSRSYQPGTLAQRVQPYVDRHELAGAVMLVADADGVLALEAVGAADLAAGAPMRADSLFWLASMTKPITATAVMMLVDEGKLALDDPVEQYLPEFTGLKVIAEQDDEHVLLRRPRHPITVRNVLSHTAGMPFASRLETPTLDALPLPLATRSYAMESLIFEPDTSYAYSNAGINTAARMLEVLAGQPYEVFLQQRLLDPLGMRDTTFWPSEQQLRRLATVYQPDEAGTGLEPTRISQLQYPLSDRSNRFPMPAGGLFGTAEDMAAFGRMILRGGELDGRRYVSAEAIDEMARRQTAPELEQSYGLGWFLSEGSFGHGGALATNLIIDREHGLVFVWLVQHAGFPGEGGAAQGVCREAAVAAFAKG